jgi:hypothetical protein
LLKLSINYFLPFVVFFAAGFFSAGFFSATFFAVAFFNRSYFFFCSHCFFSSFLRSLEVYLQLLTAINEAFDSAFLGAGLTGAFTPFML